LVPPELLFFAAPPELLPPELLPPELLLEVLFFAAPPELRLVADELVSDELRDEPPLERDEPPDEPDEPPLARLVPPLDDELLDDDFLAVPERLVPAAVAAAVAAPAAAPTAAPVTAALRREVLVPVFSPLPAVKETVARSGMAISFPVRGLRPVRAARVFFVNLPKPGMENEPAA
jgi:hypothetical protein